MLERSLQRRVLELKARCSRTEVGCKWVDELRHLEHTHDSQDTRHSERVSETVVNKITLVSSSGREMENNDTAI